MIDPCTPVGTRVEVTAKYLASCGTGGTVKAAPKGNNSPEGAVFVLLDGKTRGRWFWATQLAIAS